MPTGKKPASDAGKQLRSKKSTKAEREVAGSDLAQARGKPAPRKPARKPSARKPTRKSKR